MWKGTGANKGLIEWCLPGQVIVVGLGKDSHATEQVGVYEKEPVQTRD